MRNSEINIVPYSSDEMAELFALRHEVFVIEQAVPIELEIDEYDPTATHLRYVLDNKVVGTLRILDKHGHAKIGRVAVKKEYRGQGIGKAIMLFALDYAQQQKYETVFLDAQTDALDFYVKLGFVAEGDVFMDAGIPHMRMVKKL